MFNIWNDKWLICGYLPKDRMWLINNAMFKIYSWKVETNTENDLSLLLDVVPGKRD